MSSLRETAYHAAKLEHHVTVIEAAPELGGMAAHFDFGGLSTERYYHLVCKADQAIFDLLAYWAQRSHALRSDFNGILFAWCALPVRRPAAAHALSASLAN